MNETLQKWNDEFNILKPETEPTIFLLLKDYHDSFNNHKSNHILDEQNRILIDERVAKKSSLLQEGQTLIGVFNPYDNKDKLDSLVKKKNKYFFSGVITKDFESTINGYSFLPSKSCRI